ncbi:MAG TPA: transglutaminase domain-containing protein [Candidatus Xenobia bacterium]|jgi:transglutaminase-like putative cysteine protease
MVRERIWGALGAVVWALAAGILAWQLTLSLAAWSAVGAVLLGVFLAPRLADSRVRFGVVWLGGVCLCALVLMFTALLRGAPLAPTILGPLLAFSLSEILRWFCLTFILVIVLRASSLRYRAFLVLEVALVATIFAAIFAGHREGFINRPYFLVDPIWAKGLDPLPAFLAIGAAVAALVVILVATQKMERRNLLDLGLLLLLIVGIFAMLPEHKIKDIPKIREQLEGKPKTQGKHPSGKHKGNKQDGDGKGTPSPTPAGQTPPDWPELRFEDQPSGGSNQPVAVVILHGDTDPASDWYYFRQTAFSLYNGQRLIRDTTGQADRDLPEFFPTSVTPVDHAPTVPGTEVDENTTVALLTQHSRPFALVDPTSLSSADNPDPRRFQRAYEVSSQILTKGLLQLLPYDATVPLPPDWHVPMPSDALRQHYLDAPADDRYKKLVDQILANVRPEMRDNAVARASAIKLWLEKNGTYSLTSKYADSEDPVSDFLFGDKTGYCVFFAHAATYLFRTAGVPARVAAGYAVSARSRGSGSALLIREEDSHAWPEIYLQGIGWVVLDIIPEKSIAQQEDPVDTGQQQMLGDMARKGATNPESQQKHHGDLQEMLRALIVWLLHEAKPAILMFLMAMYVWKIVRRVQPWLCPESRVPVLAYRTALDELADVGRVRRFGQTREGFAESQAQVCPRLSDLTILHLQATMGDQRPRFDRKTVLGWIQEIARQAGCATPWYRRLWGIINPIAWWRVR